MTPDVNRQQLADFLQIQVVETPVLFKLSFVRVVHQVKFRPKIKRFYAIRVCTIDTLRHFNGSRVSINTHIDKPNLPETSSMSARVVCQKIAWNAE
jgi:hypothetical protein